MRIVFLMPVAAQPRFAKRIASLIAEGAQALALAFTREYAPGKPLPCPVVDLGPIQHGRYLSRAGRYLRTLTRIRAAARDADAIHAFGLDLLLLAWLATRGRGQPVELVYEIGDIRSILTGRGWASALLRACERFLCRRCRAIVVTAPGFVSGYFQGWQGLRGLPYVVIENKLPNTYADALARCAVGADVGPIRIGFFGLLPCRRSWDVLRAVVQRGGGRFEVLARGKPTWEAELRADVAATPGLAYGGPYVSPDDLPDLYGAVDLIWTAHAILAENDRWALSNRYYEACGFGRPQIGQAGTGDGERICAQGLGPIIDLADPETAIGRLLAIDRDDLRRWRDQVRRLPAEAFRYTDEHRRLFERLTLTAASGDAMLIGKEWTPDGSR